MPRLFVAIDLPASVTTELVRFLPPPTPGLRLVPSDQMHLTLHFIGEANIEPVAAALATVLVLPFEIQIQHVGRFPPTGRANVLWAGVRESLELLDLHAAVGNALATTGFQPESRTYAPHITLARCGHKVPVDLVNEFLETHQDLSLPPFQVTGFTLYSSTIIDDAPVYRREWTSSK